MPQLPPIFIEEFDYQLPSQKIAEHPVKNRDESRLLIYDRGNIENSQFNDVSNYLGADSILVLNNSRVIAARLHFQKATGGLIEVFCLEPYKQSIENAMTEKKSGEWQCIIGGASKWKPNLVLQKKLVVYGAEVVLDAQLMRKEEDHYIISFSWTGGYDFSSVLKHAGAIPLPPYIKRPPDGTDPERYQTVFAQNNGSVAAPTAALHFTEEVFKKLRDKNIESHFVTLHVGAGTFKPMKSSTAAEHHMHSEPFSVNIQSLEAFIKADKIVAVGTTSLRTLESLYWLALKVENGEHGHDLSQWEAYTLVDKRYTYSEALMILVNYLKAEGKSELHCRTALMILPGYSFKSARALITNFHQPRSTLLLLIAAFIGEDWKKVYNHALENNYRFLSYGDSSLLWRKD